MPSPLQNTMNTLPQQGTLEWIGIRPERAAPMHHLSHAQLLAGQGLQGDHFHARAGSPRQITLIQAEHLPVIAALCGKGMIPPEILRRNLVVAGINLLALKGRRFQIGTAELEGTSLCAPCSRMEKALGPGGFNAMRGHGGLCAKVLSTDRIQIGDKVVALPPRA
ncbi:MOSC domain-containing protein [Ferrimonas pelagia]|uniref:MOSC domain-containing protein n=1 Tax=Ferrimonas pelagia TaxID=1177826 RepID=A0ABP9ENL1_9GAMM